MTIETRLCEVLNDLVAGRVFPDIAPPDAEVPYITYQQVGGDPVNLLTGESPGKKNARMQINVWAGSRLEASGLTDQVESALRAATDLQPEVLTGRLAMFDQETRRRGFLQDYSLWY